MRRTDLEALLDLQSGVIARRQALARGLSDHDIRRLVRRNEWVRVHPGVLVNPSGELTWLQRAWAAVLIAEGVALSHGSAIRPDDGPGRRGADDVAIHIAVDRRRNLDPPPGVIRHYVTDLASRVRWNTSPPRIRIEHATLDVAADARDDFGAIGCLSEAIQARRTTASRILEALDSRERIPRRAFLRGVLSDIADGACSVLEHGYLDRVERLHGLPAGSRQVLASSRGPVYRDVEYRDQGLVVELDSRLFHDSTKARDRDLDRDLDAAVDGRLTVRLGWGQVFGRACETASRIGQLLRQRGWTGETIACPNCPGSLRRAVRPRADRDPRHELG